MKENKSIFQIAIAMIFGLMFFVGFIVLSTYKSPVDKDQVDVGSVIIWGTLDENIVNKILNNIVERDGNYNGVRYVEKSKSTYNQDILEALAAQEAPDLILLSNENFLKNRNKIYSIPQTIMTQRDYVDTYADAFSVYLGKDGILGIPFVIDPMVMYYNKNLFSTNRVVVPPTHWEEFEDPLGITSKIRLTDSSGNILKSAIAFGESLNVTNYKEILYTLFLQFNNPIIVEGDGVYVPSVNGFANSSDVIKFYTQFSNQSNKITYSWNRSMNDSVQSFLSENLATYFGFSSEIKQIRLKNPNLNFDVFEIPSFQNSRNQTVYAKTWVFAIPKMSQNKTGALAAALEFSSVEAQNDLVESIFLPPVRKDLLNSVPEDLFMDVFYKEAIYANSILDPDTEATNQIFSDYVSNVNTGLRQPSTATSILSGELEILLRDYKF